MPYVLPPFDPVFFWNTVFDKGLLGGVLTVLLYGLNRSLERFKAGQAFELERAKIRIQKAQRVWALVGDFGQQVRAADLLPSGTGEWSRTRDDPFESLQSQIAANMQAIAEERRAEELWLGPTLCRALDQLEREVAAALYLLTPQSASQARVRLHNAHARIEETRRAAGWL